MSLYNVTRFPFPNTLLTVKSFNMVEMTQSDAATNGNYSSHDFAPLKNDLLLRTARNEKVERPPIWVMRQAGRYLPQYHERKGKKDFFECCRDEETSSDLTVQPIDEYAGLLDAAIIFSDILVVPQAMGMEVVMLEKAGPHFPHPLKSPEDKQYSEIMERKVDAKKELDYVYKALTMTRKKLDGRVPLFGFCGAPWTLLCYMVEGGGSKLFKEIKRWIYQYPQASAALLQRIAEVCVDYLALQVAAGAQVSTAACNMSNLQTYTSYRLSKFSTRGRVRCHRKHSRTSPSHTLITLLVIYPGNWLRWAWRRYPWWSSRRALGML